MRRNHLPTAPPPITITNHNHCHSTRGFAAQHGAEVNNYGGIFIRGKAYNITKKLQVAEKYIQAKSKGVIRPIAQEFQVSCAFVSKIEGEMLNNEQRILTPEEIRDASDKPQDFVQSTERRMSLSGFGSTKTQMMLKSFSMQSSKQPKKVISASTMS